MPPQLPTPLPARLDASAFPASTPLNAFFAWNAARYWRDRRYVIACDIYRLLQRFDDGIDVCVAHLASGPVIGWRFGRRIAVSPSRLLAARRSLGGPRYAAAAATARRLVDALLASIGATDPALHAAVFRQFEELARFVDLEALARLRRPRKPPQGTPWEILVIKLGALGDVIQALGPMPEIRRHHASDRITLLTTPRYA